MVSHNWAGKTIGERYQIEALLGQGGMSAVYRAFDPNLRRTVAIKLIHPHLSTDPNFVGRFKEEAAAVARLRHPNIVQVHDFNLDGETYFMVMEYLVGETLQARLKRLNSTGRRMSFSDAIEICIQICNAGSYAHNHELIHRDIKPANIMLDVNGQAILMDFGIVKIIGGEYHTSTGATIGTAMYMSPEQIRGERVDDRSDIYSLGVTLYEMISGRPPYQADSVATLMMMVLNDPLPDLREVREDIPDRLLAVIRQALAKDKSKRYQSMSEMADALQQVQAKLKSALPTSTEVDSNIAPPSRPAGPSTAETRSETDLLPKTEYGEPPSRARLDRILTAKDFTKPGKMVSTVSPEQSKQQEPIAAPLEDIVPKTKKTQRSGFRHIVIPIVGALLLLALMAGGYLYYASKQPPVSQLVPITYTPISINDSTAKSVVSLGKWNTGSSVTDLVFSPDGTLLVTANNRDWVRLSQYRFYSGLWQIDTGSLQRYLTGHESWVSGVAFSSDSQHIATASEDYSINLWQGSTGNLERKIETSFGSLSGIDFSSNNVLLGAGSLDGYIGLWQVNNGNLLRTMQKQEYSIEDVKFSPDGSLLAAASDDSSVLLWRVSDGGLAMTLKSHTDAVYRVAFSRDGSLLASASADHSVALWRLSDGELLQILQEHSETVKAVAFSSDGSLLASVSEDGTLRLWRVKDGQLLNTFMEEEGLLSVAFSPDGYLLVSGGSNGTIHFWGISEAIPLDLTSTPASP